MDPAITTSPLVIDGYVRLSRDDNKRNYSSIENQKKIIRQYAREHNMVLRRIYEDDGISGYSFDRPAFQSMMAHLNAIDVIVAKDLSRIGRHNAKVLLFLEEMEEQGKRVPEDCSLVCFDYSGPDWEAEGITCSVHQGRQMGRLVATQLMTMIERRDCDDKNYTYVMKPKIYEGTSIRTL